jgi:DNA-binding Lrp family transcriptional regulator
MKMNEQILSIMETDGRISLEELAERVGEPQEKVAAAIDEMEKDNVICGYHTLINWDKTEEEKVIALIEVKVTPQREMGFDTIAQRIYQYPEVRACYLMSGGFDFTVIIEAKTMRAVAMFVAEKLAPIDSVISTATHFILKKYKDHGTVLCDEPRDERMMVNP